MTDAPRKRSRTSSRILALVLGSLAGVVGAIALTAMLHRDPLDRVTLEGYRQARERWEKAAIADYDLEVRVIGPQEALYRIEVRDGEVTRGSRNGQEITRPAIRDVWSIEGMFDVISEDLRLAELAAAGKAPEGTPTLSLYGRWQAELGYPERYRRVMSGQSGETSWAHRVSQGSSGGGQMGGEASWQVVKFARP